MKPYKNLKTFFVRGYEVPSFDWVFNIPFDVDEIVVKSFSIQLKLITELIQYNGSKN